MASEPLTITILEGDETGQELLEQALRVLDPDVVGLPIELDRYDLSLEKRRETNNQIVHDAADWRAAFLVSAAGAGTSALLAATRWRTLERGPVPAYEAAL